MKTMLLFDIDGTLLLTGGVGKIAFEIAFEELFGVPNAWGNLFPDGKTDPVIIDELALAALGKKLSKKEFEQLTERYLACFKKEIARARKFRLMPGVKRLLQKLSRNRNLVLGLATGNLEEAGWLKLERGNIHSHFGFGGFGSDSKRRTQLTKIAVERGRVHAGENIPKSRIFVIGDTPHDINAGKALGLNTLVVATGSHGKKSLLKHKPDFCLDRFTKAEKFLECVSAARS